MTTSLVLFLALFFFFLLLSAFFAASETALVALGRIDLQHMRERKIRGADTVDRLKKQPARLLSAALIGQNLATSAASAVATVAAENLFGEKIGIAAAVVVSTILLFSLGEMTPKSIAAASPARVSVLVARPFELFTRAVDPVAKIVIFLVHRMLALFGIPQTRPAMTEEEMKAVINIGHAEGLLEKEERERMVRVLEFGDRRVSEVMVPRPRIVAIAETATFAEAHAIFSQHKFSRVPVYRESLDNVVGVLKAKDLFDLSPEQLAAFTPARFASAPFLVPESKSLDDLFREMRRRKQHMAIAIDEYGGTAGLVTIEDAIEALLGSIQDEYDEEAPGFTKIDERTYVLDGSFRLADLESRFGLRYPNAIDETVAGLLLQRFGRIPGKGDRMRGRQAEFVVLEASPSAIQRVKMILPRRPGSASTMPGA
ncbi:MAG TPA: hemolysin family protein [Thermoanaerobaculia bacterium]|nr:hemolysin family protein [Thermoanaerobaculia bacterium]